ncbi:MAG: hypothetical protein K8963_11540, partial [Proteobacteria bacterium]|nr:hypothetical protein [Pseudomonadota bacterium]
AGPTTSASASNPTGTTAGDTDVVGSNADVLTNASLTPTPAGDTAIEQPPAPVDLLGFRLTLVDDYATLQEMCAELSHAKLICLDCETTGLDYGRDHLVGLSLAIEPDRVWYIPMAHRDEQAKQLPVRTVLNALAPILNASDTAILAHNLKFDSNVLYSASQQTTPPDIGTKKPAAPENTKQNTLLDNSATQNAKFALDAVSLGGETASQEAASQASAAARQEAGQEAASQASDAAGQEASQAAASLASAAARQEASQEAASQASDAAGQEASQAAASLASATARQEAGQEAASLASDAAGQEAGQEAAVAIDMPGVWHDTMLQACLLKENSGQRAGLDALALQYLGRENISYQFLVKRQAKRLGKSVRLVDFADIPVAEAAEYCAEDAVICLRMHSLLHPQIVSTPWRARSYEEVDVPLARILARMERRGIYVNRRRLMRAGEKFSAKIDSARSAIEEIAEGAVNPDSPKQLGKLLFDKLELPVFKRTSGRQPSTDAGVLERLAREFPASELPQLVLDFRAARKLKSTYVDDLLSRADAQHPRIHTHFQQGV